MTKPTTKENIDKVNAKMREVQEVLHEITGKNCELVLLMHKVHDAPGEVCEGVTTFTELPLDDTTGMLIKAVNNCIAAMNTMGEPRPAGTTLN